MGKDFYGTWKVTFQSRTGKVTQLNLVDSKSEIDYTATFYSPTYGRVVKVELVK